MEQLSVAVIGWAVLIKICSVRATSPMRAGLADHISAGMNLGADDYIVKPFEPAELRERIGVCLSRHEKPSAA